MSWLPRLRLLFALASGLGLAFSFAPHETPLLPWFSLAALILVSIGARWWVAALGGLLHGAACYSLTLPWIYTVMREHGGLGPTAAGGVLALMIFVLSLFPAVFSLALVRLSRRSWERALVAAPFLWVALEFARTHMPHIGFPWNLLGYSASRHLGFAQLATVTGIWGLSFAVAGYNTLLAWLLLVRTRRAWLAWLLTTAAVVPAVVVGYRFVPSVVPQQVAYLVQPNFPQHATGPGPWMERHAADLDELVELSVAAAERTPGVVIWPEVPAPFYVHDARFAARAESLVRRAGQPLIVGVVGWDADAPAEQRGPYNSAVMYDAAGRVAFRYDKVRLVPFGEYVPLRKLLGFAEPLVAEAGGFLAGEDYAIGELPGGRFGVFICYEAVFPNLVRRFTASGADVLVNLSNDGWFGRSAAPEQHLAMARVRAIENRRWLLRATNNGHTVSIDPYGRIHARMATDTRGVLRAAYDYRYERTLYSYLGDWWAWLCLAAAVAVFLWPAARKEKEG